MPYALLALGYAAWVPESPRWCIAHGKHAEAREMRHGIATRSLRTCPARGVLQAHAIVRRLTESDSRLLSYRTGTPITRRAEMRAPLLAPVDPRHVGTHTTLPRGRHSELPVVCEAGGNVGASSTGSPAARAPRIDALQPDASATDGADAATPAAAATAAAATDGLPPVSPPTSTEDAVCTRAVRDEPPSPRASTWRPRALELFSTARSSRALLIEMYLWATDSLSYYAIGYKAGNLSDQVHLNFLLISLPLFFSAYASSAAMDHPRIGRCGAAVGYFGLIAVSIGIGAIWPSAATYSSIVGNFAGEAAFNVVYIQGGASRPRIPRAILARARAVPALSRRRRTLPHKAARQRSRPLLCRRTLRLVFLRATPGPARLDRDAHDHLGDVRRRRARHALRPARDARPWPRRAPARLVAPRAPRTYKTNKSIPTRGKVYARRPNCR